MSIRNKVLTTVAAGALVAVGCQPRPSPAPNDQDSRVGEVTTWFGFAPSTNERGLLEGALKRMGERMRVRHFVASIDRFEHSDAAFLLFIVPPPDYNSGHVLFGAIRRDGSEAVGLFDTGVPFSPSSVSIEAIEDLDGDGQPDVLYCLPFGASRLPRAVALVDGAWEQLDDPVGTSEAWSCD